MIKSTNKPLRVAVIGAGIRGISLARKLYSSELKAVIAAIAEPDEERRSSFAKEFNLPDDAVFSGWKDLTDKMVGCDAAIIATLDNQHAGPAVACLNRDWHILLEKPLADSYQIVN